MSWRRQGPRTPAWTDSCSSSCPGGGVSLRQPAPVPPASGAPGGTEGIAPFDPRRQRHPCVYEGAGPAFKGEVISLSTHLFLTSALSPGHSGQEAAHREPPGFTLGFYCCLCRIPGAWPRAAKCQTAGPQKGPARSWRAGTLARSLRY